MTHGEQIRRARRERGWTQDQLAEAAGVSVGTIKNWEKNQPTRIGYEGVERALGIVIGEPVGPVREGADQVLLDLPEGTLAGLSEIDKEELEAAARETVLRRAREIRGR